MRGLGRHGLGTGRRAAREGAEGVRVALSLSEAIKRDMHEVAPEELDRRFKEIPRSPRVVLYCGCPREDIATAFVLPGALRDR